jgi:hypothetical protein
MAEIPDSVAKICKEIGLSHSEACWQLPQNKGTWVMKHKALERIAAYKKVTFELPTIIEANAEKKICIILVTGNLGEAKEWSIGEATTYNNKNGYPYAMAEKRAKDRVILKLVGLHGDVYSDIEADFEKEACAGQVEQGTASNAQARTARERQGEDTIPKAVAKFGGKDVSELNMDELCELEEVCSTNKWKTKIAEAKKVIAKSLTKPASKVYETVVEEKFTEADTAWLNLS